jgi:hypothetical protein
MGMFEHCEKCVAPKRYPGCHDKCPDYEKDRKKYEARKAELDKRKRCTMRFIINGKNK